MKTTVTRRFEFCGAHFLPDYNGKCANLHGHTWVLEVTVSKTHPTVESDGTYPTMVIDFGDLKRAVQPFIELLDHKCLNAVLEQEGILRPTLLPIPTAENLAAWFWGKLYNAIPGCTLERIRLWESPDSYAEVTL